MTRYTTRPIAWAVGPECADLFSKRVTMIELEDEAGGCVTFEGDSDDDLVVLLGDYTMESLA